MTKLSISACPVFVPIAFSDAKMFRTKVMTFSYSFMITVRSLQLIEDDLFTLRPSKEVREPERPLRRSFSFSNSAFSAELESTSLIKASMSAICFSVSSLRFRTETVEGVVSPADVDAPETVVPAFVTLSVDNELLVNLTDELILSDSVLLMVVLPLVVLPLLALPLVVLPLVVLPLVVLPLVVLPIVVLPLVVLPIVVLPLVVLPLVWLPLVALPLAVLPIVVLPLLVLPLVLLLVLLLVVLAIEVLVAVPVMLPTVVLPVVLLMVEVPSVELLVVLPPVVLLSVVLPSVVERAGQELGRTEAPAWFDRAKQYSSVVSSESPLLVYTQPSTQLGSGLSTSSTFSLYSPFKLAKLPSAFCNRGQHEVIK